MYSGFLSARDLKKIAAVPSFAPDKPHHRIAADVSNPPIDQWQRPLDPQKTAEIRQTYSRSDKDNLMANPVLIGVAVPNLSDDASVSIEPKAIRGPGGEVVSLPGYFTVVVHCEGNAKPLWILDGQHRIEGLLESTQCNEPLPFVLLSDEGLYTPPFLAEIFAQVTTGATPMQPLHAEWMKYAFRLDRYGQEAYINSMSTAIFLCKEASFAGQSNPFNNRIQFNPYIPSSARNAFSFDVAEWVSIIAPNFYGRRGTLQPRALAEQVVLALRAFERVDGHRTSGSKLNSTENPHKILAEAFLSALFRHLAAGNARASVDEWQAFFVDAKFDRCDWRLPFVREAGALSSRYGKPSKVMALECFDAALNDREVLGGHLLTDFLQGVGAVLRITAYQRTTAGRVSNRETYSARLSPTDGLTPFHLSHGGVAHDVIRIEADTPNLHVLDVLDRNVNPARKLNDATKRSGLDVSGFASGHRIVVETMSYSRDTMNSTTIRLDK